MSLEFKRLGDIATYVNGYSFKPEHWGKQGLPIIRIQNLTGSSNEVNYYEGKIDEKYIVRKGDILIAWSASLGVHEWEKEKAVLNQHIFKVVFNKLEVNKTYFKFMVQKALERVLKFLHGSTMKHITKKYFDNILIPIPSLKEQEKIANILERSKGLIIKRKAQIAALDELTQSVFGKMFGNPFKNQFNWDIKSFKEVMIGKLQNGLYKPSTDYVSFGGNPILRIDSFYNGKINDIQKFKRITCSQSDLDKYSLKINDIVINRVNSLEYLGKCGLVRDLKEPTVFESNMMRITIDTDLINPFYLVKLLSSDYVYNQILSKAKKSVNQASINQKDVSGFHIVCPPIELQNEFSSKIDGIEEEKSKLNKSLIVLQRFYDSLQQRAFDGEQFSPIEAPNI